MQRRKPTWSNTPDWKTNLLGEGVSIRRPPALVPASAPEPAHSFSKWRSAEWISDEGAMNFAVHFLGTDALGRLSERARQGVPRIVKSTVSGLPGPQKGIVAAFCSGKCLRGPDLEELDKAGDLIRKALRRALPKLKEPDSFGSYSGRREAGR